MPEASILCGYHSSAATQALLAEAIPHMKDAASATVINWTFPSDLTQNLPWDSLQRRRRQGSHRSSEVYEASFSIQNVHRGQALREQGKLQSRRKSRYYDSLLESMSLAGAFSRPLRRLSEGLEAGASLRKCKTSKLIMVFGSCPDAPD